MAPPMDGDLVRMHSATTRLLCAAAVHRRPFCLWTNVVFESVENRVEANEKGLSPTIGGNPFVGLSGGGRQALPRMRLSFVPQTGHVPCAIRRPDSLTRTSPVKSRFSLHFTQ